MKKRFSIPGEIFLYVIPSIICIVFHILCICGQVQPKIYALSVFQNAVIGLFDITSIFFAIIISFIIGIVLAPLTVVASFLFIPLAGVTGDAIGFGDLAVLTMSVAFVLMIIGAFKLPLFGEFEEDSSYVSGTHWEITFDRDGNGTAKEVNEYSGGGECLINALRFLGRLIVIGFGGWLIFIIHLCKHVTQNG